MPPTHAFGLSRAATREDAAGQDSPVEVEIGVREWLDAALPVASTRAAAAFRTKIAHPPWVPGSAAKGIGKRLRHLGYHLAAAPADFLVEDMTGPLRSGEIERATAWATHLGATEPATSAERP
ncbi:flavodoxin family protein [Nocardia sp. NPDC003979]